jgi:hypothetical protein
MTDPLLGSRRCRIMDISVDFPDPERPQIATCLPGRIEMLMSFSTSRPVFLHYADQYSLFFPPSPASAFIQLSLCEDMATHW